MIRHFSLWLTTEFASLSREGDDLHSIPTINICLCFRIVFTSAHTDLETYRKLMQVFPVGPVRSASKWQVDNMHYPRQQNCALSIMEQMERNGVMLDEEFVQLTIDIFGDWTHAVKKAKRQLYWIPKFRHANPYPIPWVMLVAYKVHSR